MAALTQSVEAARRSRSETLEPGEPATVHDLPEASAKESAAKKQSAKKATRFRGKSA
ncbi:hypothetical protein [Streptomyces sp. SID1121]|uniref:hypothetical protein n=1 Tax=Streptomyces sp. SID1121 TaxID=3425888 RepID=UPI00405672A2